MPAGVLYVKEGKTHKEDYSSNLHGNKILKKDTILFPEKKTHEVSQIFLEANTVIEKKGHMWGLLKPFLVRFGLVEPLLLGAEKWLSYILYISFLQQEIEVSHC